MTSEDVDPAVERRKDLHEKLKGAVAQHNAISTQIEQLQVTRNQIMGRVSVYQEELAAAGGPLPEPGPDDS